MAGNPNPRPLRHPITIVFRVDEELKKLLQKASIETGLSVAFILRKGGREEALRLLKESNNNPTDNTREMF